MGKVKVRIDAEKVIEALGFRGMQVENIGVDKKAGRCVELTVSTKEKTKKSSRPETAYYNDFRAVSTAVSSTMDLNEILELIVKHLKKTLRVKGCAIMLLDKKRQHLELAASVGLSKNYLGKGPITSRQSASTLERGKPISILNVADDKRVQYPEQAVREGIVSMLSVPISVRGTVIGLVRLYTATERRFEKGELEYVTAVAEQGGLAIENARLLAQVEADYKGLMDDTWRWFEQSYPPLSS